MAQVGSILKGEASVTEVARKHGLVVTEVEDCGEKFLLGENALRNRPKDEKALKDEQIKKLNQKIDDLVLDKDILWEALKPDPKPEKWPAGAKRPVAWSSQTYSCHHNFFI